MNGTPHLDRDLFTAAEINARVNAIADDIARDFGSDEFLAVALLKGSFVFTADLIRALARHHVNPMVDFLALSSYGSACSSSGKVTLRHELSLPVKGHRVLLIDDILDTGLTLQTACNMLAGLGASEVRTCVLLDKPSRRVVPVSVDYTGFQVEDVFVVGYGLDYNNRYRHLPGLSTLRFDKAAPGAA
jgi:hypoxanthine phosphoribosyltransferase